MGFGDLTYFCSVIKISSKMKKLSIIAALAMVSLFVPSSTLKDIVKATPKSDHRDGICVVTKEMGGQGMDKKQGQIDKWLTEIGY